MRRPARKCCVEPLECRRLLAAYHLTFDDEFNTFKMASGSTTFGWMPYDYWNNRTLSGNGEQEYYCNPTTDAYNPFSVNNGILSITARPTPAGMNTNGLPYVSGEITTTTGSQWSNPKNKGFSQKYGYFELRAKLPYGKGLWPAFWLLPADASWPPEYDIFEVLGHDPTTIYQTAHWKDANGVHQSQGYAYKNIINSTTGFHTYGFLWDATSVKWYVDGVLTQTQANRVNAPMYILINLAVGGTWPGNPDATTVFPASMELDYVRVYSSDAAVPAVTPDAGAVPTGWSDTDIGATTYAGWAGYNASSGAYTLTGSGTDIGGTSDQFHFASKALSADGEIIARVSSVTTTDTSAKGGVMFRGSTSGDAPFAAVVQMPNNEVLFEYRTATGVTAQSTARVGGTAAAKWVRLVRSGNSFSAYYATTTGIPASGSWIQIGTTQTISMANVVRAGLAVTSRNNAAVCTATFTDVSVNDSLPVVQSFAINAGATQRSMVQQLAVNFSEPVTLGSGLNLKLHGGAVVPNVTLSPSSSDSRSYTLTFTGSAIIGRSLPDGIYDLLLTGAAVADSTGNTVASNSTWTFHRLFGDSDGNKIINSLDYARLKQTFGRAPTDPLFNSAFDYEANALINALDLARFRQRYGISYSY